MAVIRTFYNSHVCLDAVLEGYSDRYLISSRWLVSYWAGDPYT